jgi:hypothetical protein
MQATQTVVFAPQNKLQVKALLQYIEINRPAINARKTEDYVASVNNVKEIMRGYFAVNPPQIKVKVCPWDIMGTSKMCRDIAEQFKVPYWDIIAEANPYM